MTHIFIPKGKYVFRQGDESKGFFGIIKGSISLRVNSKKPLTTVLKRSYFRSDSSFPPDPNEKEITTLSAGFTFGEWGLMRRTVRRTSAFTLEDSHFFHIAEGPLFVSISKTMMKAESDRKIFIIKQIEPFEELNKTTFDSLYNSMIPSFVGKNEMVYLEKTNADALYLILSGSLSLLKHVENYTPTDFSPMKFITMLKVEKGAVVGVDCLFEKNYKYSLRSDSDNTSMLIIKLDSLDKLIREKLKDFFKDFYLQHERNFKSTLDKRKEHELKVQYREPLKKNIQTDEKVLELKIKQQIKSTLNIKKPTTNIFRNYKIKVFKNFDHCIKDLEGIPPNTSHSKNIFKLTKINSGINSLSSKKSASVPGRMK